MNRKGVQTLQLRKNKSNLKKVKYIKKKDVQTLQLRKNRMNLTNSQIINGKGVQIREMKTIMNIKGIVFPLQILPVLNMTLVVTLTML
jgi:hypothetical protein